MVWKHEMVADFEKLTYDGGMLKNEWVKSLESARSLVSSNWTTHHLLTFIEWISGTGYSSLFFPGFSLGTLLISKPRNGKLNYQQTLRVAYDRQRDLFEMKFSDWDTIDSREDYEKAVLWAVHCPGVDLARHFVEFLEWKKDWG